MKIAVIAPKEKDDYLLNDLLDGLFQVGKEKADLVVRISKGFIHPFPHELIKAVELDEKEFFEFAGEADIIVLAQRKDGTNFELAEKIGLWHKTVFLDGSELGKNRRLDFSIQNEVLHGRYKENGGVDMKMLEKCALYFRREKPYLLGIVAFPYSIQSSYLHKYASDKIKDMDFACIFGQDEFPLMRRYAVQILEEFCRKNGFSYRIGKTKGFDFSLDRKSGRDEFYDILSRSKVGISIGGGGSDTVRFWETLANNCLLITEKIDVFQPDSKELSFDRISECNNLYDFKYKLEKIGNFLRTDYRQENLEAEHKEIIKKHSSKARAEKLIDLSLEAIKKKGAEAKEAQKCAIVISSCNKYSDLWEPFFSLFFKYWPDCPFPIYLISNTLRFDDKRVKTLLLGEDKGWASNIKSALSQISEPFILYMQEDYLLQSPVKTNKIQSLIRYMSKEEIASIRLIGSPDPRFEHNNPFNLMEVRKGEKYRVSLQAALWNKNAFINLLKEGETGWDMEEKGSIRSGDSAGLFLSTRKRKPILDYYYYTAIKKGKWMPGALRLLKREKIYVEASKRGTHTNWGVAKGEFKKLLSKLSAQFFG